MGLRDRSRRGLPAEFTTFVGRREDLTQVKRLLRNARLITLTGVGGTGKTRLALRLAEAVRRHYSGGVCLVDLASLPDQMPVECAVADALGVRDRGGRPQSEALIEFLRDRELLLVLDNCEHVAAECAGVVDLMLRAVTGLRVICTSRQPLGTAGEHVCRVPPMAVPEPGAPTRAATGCEYPAVELFAQRAAAAAPGFAVTDDNREQVAEICRRLDGLPLALELAACQLRNLSVGQFSERLHDWSPVLTSRYAVPSHHRTLAATFDWSFQLCTSAERRLWSRMSVFADGMELAAIEYVCAEGAPLLDVVAGLVDKSVLLREEMAGRVRYRLLETLRQYGLGRLRAGGGDEAALRRRHRQWYLQLARRVDADWFGPRREEWAARLRREEANLRAALSFCLADGDPECALEIVSSLRSYWLKVGSAREGGYWAERALTLSSEPPAGRIRALATKARLLTVVGKPEDVAAGAFTVGTERLRGRREGTHIRVREALGPAAFDVADRNGESLSVEYAVAHGLGGTTAPTTRNPAETDLSADPLTPRERQVAALIAQGLSDKQIAAALTIALRTAQSHVANILRKLGFASRTRVAIRYARGNQAVDPRPAPHPG